MPAHTHTQDAHLHYSYSGTNFITDLGAGNQVVTAAGGNFGFRTYVPYTNYATATNQNTGGGGSFGLLQPSRSALLVIKT